MRSFGMIPIRISDLRLLGSWCIKRTTESTLECEQSLFFFGIVERAIPILQAAKPCAARNEAASLRSKSYFNLLLGPVHSPPAAYVIRIAGSTVPKKNTRSTIPNTNIDYSQSTLTQTITLDKLQILMGSNHLLY